MSSGKMRNVCFTLNNADDSHLKKIQETLTRCTYYVIGREIGKERHTPHLQGYVEFANPRAFTAIKKELLGAHIEPRKGTSQQASDYCKKDGNFIEWGEISNQGTASIYVEIKNAIKDGATLEDIAEISPQTFIKYHAGIAKMFELLKPKRRMKVPDFKLHKWQEDIINIIAQKHADDRKIYWIVDTIGGAGKTYLCQYIKAKFESSIRFENASSRDIAYAYNGEKIALFDFVKSCEERINYGAIESIKNGMLFSAKYASTSKEFDERPHVICFSNFVPNLEKLSSDRLVIINVSKYDTKKGIAEESLDSIKTINNETKDKETLLKIIKDLEMQLKCYKLVNETLRSEVDNDDKDYKTISKACETDKKETKNENGERILALNHFQIASPELRGAPFHGGGAPRNSSDAIQKRCVCSNM